MASFGLFFLSFFSQIAKAILIKKTEKTSTKQTHKIYDDKNLNSFLAEGREEAGQAETVRFLPVRNPMSTRF